MHVTDLDHTLAVPDAPPVPKHEDFMMMRVVKPVGEAAEVFNTYGELGNAALLRSYGFTQTNNPADCVTIGGVVHVGTY